MRKVFLGVGHGGSDPGAVANGFREKDLNLAIALACNEELVRHGVTTLMSRRADEEDPLNEEIRECNAFAPELAVDIHNNAGGGDGAEAFYHFGGGTGKILAENILAQIVAAGQNSRGAKTRKNDAGRDWYGFIRETACPAVIVECAFVDNTADLAAVDTPEEQTAMGVAVAKGILATLGIPHLPLQTVPSTPEKEPVVEVEPIPEEEPVIEEEPTPEEEPILEEEPISGEDEVEYPDPEEETEEKDSFWEKIKRFFKDLFDRFFRRLDR